MFKKRAFSFKPLTIAVIATIMGSLMLSMTVPSLRQVVTNDFEIVEGTCAIDITSSGRTSNATFHMLQSDESFTFNDIPKLDAYGKSISYHCEIMVTKDHTWTMDYTIYDVETGVVINAYKDK